MNNMTSLAGALWLAGGACGSSLPRGTGSGGSSGTGGVGGGDPIPLPSTPTGFVQDVLGGSNVIGPWYAYGDGVGANASVANGADAINSDCQSASKGGFPSSACSQIAWPPPGHPSPPSDVASSAMCTDGVAAMVMAKGGSPDSSPLTPPAGGSLHVAVLWVDVGGPYYLTQQSPAVIPPAFNPAKVQSLQFQVSTNVMATTPYAFCVSNLALLPK